MNVSTWRELYDSDLQGLYALIIIPALFLLYRMARGRPTGGVLPAGARFVDVYAIVFAVETILDPLITGSLMRALGASESAAATAALVLFVLLGDFRVYLLLFGLIAIAAGRDWRDGLRPAIGWTLVVPAVAYPLNALLQAQVAGLHAGTIWVVYELLFTAVALILRARVVPARVPAAAPGLRAFLRAVLTYVAAYYGLWALADLLIQGAGLDAGWLLRIVPNQLYYELWVPFVYFTFFSRRYAVTSASTHAARYDSARVALAPRGSPTTPLGLCARKLG